MNIKNGKMRISVFTIILFFCCVSCNNDNKDNKIDTESEITFDEAKWKLKDGEDYPYRDKMLNDIVYNDTVRSLNKDEILDLFGEPSYYRNNENFLYYRITENRLFSWILNTKTMVIKLSEDNKIDWIKIHE